MKLANFPTHIRFPIGGELLGRTKFPISIKRTKLTKSWGEKKVTNSLGKQLKLSTTWSSRSRWNRGKFVVSAGVKQIIFYTVCSIFALGGLIKYFPTAYTGNSEWDFLEFSRKTSYKTAFNGDVHFFSVTWALVGYAMSVEHYTVIKNMKLNNSCNWRNHEQNTNYTVTLINS